ncbi:MAG TPA: chorismate pyruvate-lyase family protein [Solirubrobacteraceae bacterium]|jgi:chorismate-pyruvate lyase|nr:chorismate pyruvate-lyase family protein [Solirubrobacteraceae bacterium]
MIVADRLAERHFTAQHDAPADLEQVEIVALDPFLRGLLFTDGTVSRALEAQMLAPVSVQPLEQVESSPPAPVARALELDADEACVRRRVFMSSDQNALSVWAESYLVPGRLPSDFIGVLGDSPTGIGGSLGQLKLESWRELLWFGLGRAPQWSGATSAGTTLTRSYRVITSRLPALFISEAFAVQQHGGVHHLTGAAGVPADLTGAGNGAPPTPG